MKKITKTIFFLIYFMCFHFIIIFGQQIEYENNEGIFFEILHDTINKNRYTENNKIYQEGNIYYFKYQYITKENEMFFFQYIPKYNTINLNGDVFHYISFEDWEFISKDNIEKEYIISFQMKILYGVCNTKQSCVEFRYLTNTNVSDIFSTFPSKTGFVENERNIWLHPPRNLLFKILQLNPFPFIQKPYEKGNTWKWTLKIGSDWGDERYKKWTGAVENQYVYEIIDVNCIVSTPLGVLSCCKINSYAESELGKTYLTAFFNEKYGFVRLEYVNIDCSIINIDLYKAEIK